jgi:hypothetical protein
MPASWRAPDRAPQQTFCRQPALGPVHASTRRSNPGQVIGNAAKYARLWTETSLAQGGEIISESGGAIISEQRGGFVGIGTQGNHLLRRGLRGNDRRFRMREYPRRSDRLRERVAGACLRGSETMRRAARSASLGALPGADRPRRNSSFSAVRQFPATATSLGSSRYSFGKRLFKAAILGRSKVAI